MESRPHSAITALVDRYLDPRHGWSGAADGAMRAHMDDCEACRGYYNTSVTAHRAMVGGELSTPSGFEDGRRFEALMSPVDASIQGIPIARTRFGWRAALASLAVGVAAMVVVLNVVPEGPGDDLLQARGVPTDSTLVGVGVTGVTEAGTEYEAIASGAVFQDDYIRLSYTNEEADVGYLFVFGLQPDRAPIWYVPVPEEGASLAIAQGRTIDLKFETRLARHALGPLRIVAVFTHRPLSLEAVRRTVTSLPRGVSDTHVKARILFDLDRLARVQILGTAVVPGSREETKTHAP